MELRSVERRNVIFFFPKCFFSFSFREKRAETFEIFQNRSDIPIYQLHFWFWRQFFTRAVMGTLWFLLSCFDKVVIDRGRNFRRPKVLYRRVIDGNYWKPKFFEGATVRLSLFFGPISHVWQPIAGFGIDSEVLVAFSFWPKFCFLTNFRPKVT